MSSRDRLTLAAAAAVLLACSALLPVFDGPGWLVRVTGAVVAVAGVSAGARALGLPRPLQPVAGLLALGGYVLLLFSDATLAYGVLPTGKTFSLLATTVGDGLLDVERLAPPVPTGPGLVLLAVLGVGAVAIAVDTLAVVLRQAAASGLPLLVLFAVPSAVLPGGLGVLPFVAGAAGWLGLLLADSSDTVSRWGTPLSTRRSTSAVDPTLGRTGRRIGVAALGVAVIVPALVPGLDARLLGGGDGDGFGGGSRSVVTYNPITKLAGQLSLPEPRELLRYTTNDPSPDYLRLTSLDKFDEASGWSSSELSGDPDDDRAQDGLPAPTGLIASTRTRDVSVRLEPTGELDGPWLPLPFPPRDVEIDGPWLWDAEAETVFTTRTSLAEVDEPYVVRATRVEPTVDLLRRSQTVPEKIAKTYAGRPELAPYVQDELDRVTAGLDTTYDRVAALQAYFRDESRFTYDEDATAPGIDAPDALERFLLSGQGYCEQYSSAMAAMVRGLGVPARVAVGFTPGTVVDGERVVTTNEAHAWPEVWFAGAGWVRFEPTPRSEQTTVPGYTEAPAEVASDPAASAAPSAAPSTGPLLPGDPANPDRGADGALTGPAADDSGSGPSPWLLLVPAGLLLLATPWLLAQLRTRRRWSRADALTAWAAVLDDAADVGHSWRPYDSPRAAAVHLLAARPLDGPATDALLRLAAGTERARYARPGEADAYRPTSLRRDVAAIRAGLLVTVAGRARLVARFAPPSTLRWASAGLGSFVADVLDRVDGLVSATGARARHPRSRRAT